MYASIRKCIAYLDATHMLMDKNFRMVYVEATMTLVSKQGEYNGNAPEVVLAAQIGYKLIRIDHVNLRLTDEVLLTLNDQNSAIPNGAYLGVGTTLH